MSSKMTGESVKAIGESIMRWQDANENFDHAVCKLFGLSSAERRCLSCVCLGPQPASAIATETALTPAAVTSLIDRLESRGLIRRGDDPGDRRKVLVTATGKTHQLIARAYLPFARAGANLLSKYSAKEL